MKSGLRAEHLLEVSGVHRRNRACVEPAEAFRQLERGGERLLHRHLLVEHEPDREREGARAEECVGLGVAGEVER